MKRAARVSGATRRDIRSGANDGAWYLERILPRRLLLRRHATRVCDAGPGRRRGCESAAMKRPRGVHTIAPTPRRPLEKRGHHGSESCPARIPICHFFARRRPPPLSVPCRGVEAAGPSGRQTSAASARFTRPRTIAVQSSLSLRPDHLCRAATASGGCERARAELRQQGAGRPPAAAARVGADEEDESIPLDGAAALHRDA